MYKSDHVLEQGWVRTHPLDTPWTRACYLVLRLESSNQLTYIKLPRVRRKQ